MSEDSDHVPQRAACSQRSVASTVPAWMNLSSLSCTGTLVREYESITESFSSTGKPVQSDESVASVERNSSREHVDQNLRSHQTSTHRKLESQRMELHQANQWAREKED